MDRFSEIESAQSGCKVFSQALLMFQWPAKRDHWAIKRCDALTLHDWDRGRLIFGERLLNFLLPFVKKLKTERRVATRNRESKARCCIRRWMDIAKILRNVKSKKVEQQEENFITVVASLASCVFIKSFIIEENRKQTCKRWCAVDGLCSLLSTSTVKNIYNEITLPSNQIYHWNINNLTSCLFSEKTGSNFYINSRLVNTCFIRH